MIQRLASTLAVSLPLLLANAPAEASMDDIVTAYNVLETIPSPPASAYRSAPTWGYRDYPGAPTSHTEAHHIPYLHDIERVARRNGLDPRDLLALIRAESAFDRMAVSSKGARGLMQLMPVHATSNGITVRELFDPQKNLEIGARYFAELLERHADKGARQYDYALAAWNFGPAAVDAGYRWPAETREFIQRFKRFKRDYQATLLREGDL